MRTFPLLLLISLHLAAQEPVKIQVLSHPRHLVIDSKDNLYVTMKYGIARVSPEGQFTDLRKLEGGNRIDMSFENGGLVIDSRDNLIAVIGASIYKITIRDDKIQVAPMAGNALNGKYGIEDGQLPAAKLQEIGLVAIQKRQPLYHPECFLDQGCDERKAFHNGPVHCRRACKQGGATVFLHPQDYG